MKKYRYEIIIFVVDAICMILELVASRLLSPYFGSSNLVWTSVIGIILLSSSIGNYLGGIIADKEGLKLKLKEILSASAIAILIIPIIQETVLMDIAKITSSIKLGAILATLFLFFIPSLLMGLMTPIVLRLKLENIETAGKASGRIYAIATIGGIIGTFLGGFLLIPNLGSVEILFVLAIIVVLLAPLVDFKFSLKSSIVIIITILISLIFLYTYSQMDSNNSEKVISGNEDNYVSYDTEYGRVLIYNMEQNGKPIRMLNIDSGYESATYTNPDEVNELVFEYSKYYDLMFKANIDIKNTLLIGGARLFLPKILYKSF